MYEARETARAVAALLHLAAVGIEDAVEELGIRVTWRLDEQHLVTADAEAPVGDRADLRLVERDLLVDRVEHDEVVAQPVHLGELMIMRLSIAAAAACGQGRQCGRWPHTARWRSLTIETVNVQPRGLQLGGDLVCRVGGEQRIAEIAPQHFGLVDRVGLDQRVDGQFRGGRARSITTTAAPGALQSATVCHITAGSARWCSRLLEATVW